MSQSQTEQVHKTFPEKFILKFVSYINIFNQKGKHFPPYLTLLNPNTLLNAFCKYFAMPRL